MVPGQWITVPTRQGGHYTIPLSDLGEMLDILQANRQGEEEPLDTLGRMSRDILRFETWVADLQSGMYINCVYCGHRYGPAENTPVAMSTLLTKHIETCSKHPLSHARATIENYQRIVNYWFPLLGFRQANDMAYPALNDPRAYPSPILTWAEEHGKAWKALCDMLGIDYNPKPEDVVEIVRGHMVEWLRGVYEKVGESLAGSGAAKKIADQLGLKWEEPAGVPLGNTGMVITPLPEERNALLGFAISLLADYVPKALMTKGWADVKEDLRAMALKFGMPPEAVLAWAEAGLPRDFQALKK